MFQVRTNLRRTFQPIGNTAKGNQNIKGILNIVSFLLVEKKIFKNFDLQILSSSLF